MRHTVTEVQDKNTTRTYNLSGPQLETIIGFWSYLKDSKTIEDYKVEEG